MEQVRKSENRFGDTDCCGVHEVRSRSPVMTDSDGIVAGNDLSGFRIARELRGHGVNCICLASADLVRANKQTLRVGNVPVNTTGVSVVGAE